MRPSPRLLVRPRRPVRETPPLIPPIQLYRKILRAHGKVLPRDMRFLGDRYVKEEFKAHKNVDNPLFIVGFLAQWQDYLRQIDNGDWSVGKLLQQALEKMLPEQVNQLYELMKATKNLPEEEDEPVVVTK